jgi:hypothetical protein
MLQHSSHNFVDVIGEDLESSFAQHFPRTINYHLSSQYAKYVKFEIREICINSEALQFQSMFMSSSHCLISIRGMNDAIHFEILSQGMLQTNFTYESHHMYHSLSSSLQQSHDDHCRFYDRIESWLEESYMPTCTLNHNITKFNLLGGDLVESILPIFHPLPIHSLRLTFNEHMVVGLELLDWLH